LRLSHGSRLQSLDRFRESRNDREDHFLTISGLVRKLVHGVDHVSMLAELECSDNGASVPNFG
jgi:hypothetical protein